MGNSLRCCLACVLPCGALDLTRIIHLNSYIEEITGPVTAGELLKAYPNHVLIISKPSSQGVVRKILILSHESELKRGSFYFLIPQSSLPFDHRNHSDHKKPPISTSDNKTLRIHETHKLNHENVAKSNSKSGGHRRRRSSRGKSGFWQPQLESITED